MTWKEVERMTGKEVVNLIRKLREKGMSSDDILEIIEYIETHDPKEQESIWYPPGGDNA